MAEFPALPLWTDAFLADTTHLSRDEMGAYLMLLMTAWRRPECDLPDDDEFLARVVRADLRYWRSKLRAQMLVFHSLVHNSRGETVWVQKRLQKERMYVREHSAQQSAKANVRWSKNKDLFDAAAMPDACRTDAPTPTPLGSTETSSGSSSPPPDQKSKSNGFRGVGRPPPTTIDDPHERMVRFQERLAKALGPEGHTIAHAAASPSEPLHLRALALCKAKAREPENRGGLGVKDWPYNWHLLYPKPRTRGPP